MSLRDFVSASPHLPSRIPVGAPYVLALGVGALVNTFMRRRRTKQTTHAHPYNTQLTWFVAADARRLYRRLATLGGTALTYWLYSVIRQRYSLEARLRREHEHMLLMLRAWLLSTEIFRLANQTNHQSYANLTRLPVSDDYADELKPAVRLLLETTGIPPEAAQWFRKDWRLWTLKRLLDIMYCGFYAGYNKVRRRA